MGAPSVAGLFAGIGGIELGLHEAGFRTELLCEIDSAAQRVLRKRCPDVELTADVRDLHALPEVDLVAAGFPCQDLSQAGRTRGIDGHQSGLVGEVFRLVDGLRRNDTWLLLENVPFMLQLDRGHGMRFLTESLEELGYRWAYRVVDTRAFGLPHRRQRVILLASRTDDPRPVLFATDAGEPPTEDHDGLACGFYWTEGVRGLGWAVDSVPTLKGGSTVGIPSPPAIWMPSGEIVTPDVRDAERLQGFETDWTAPALDGDGRKGARWKLVGNAVSVPVASWVGSNLRSSAAYIADAEDVWEHEGAWPRAAWGAPGDKVHLVELSRWPVDIGRPHLEAFLQFAPRPLSVKATAGFLRRTETSTLRFPAGFLDAVRAHLHRMEFSETAA